MSLDNLYTRSNNSCSFPCSAYELTSHYQHFGRFCYLITYLLTETYFRS